MSYKHYCIGAVIISKDFNYTLEYLLAILNSKLMTYYLYEQTPKSSNKSYPSFSSELIKNIPIKNITLEVQEEFSMLVKEIYNKQANNKDYSSIDFEIDKLVYGIYEIKKEEQKLIENRFNF